MFLFTHDSQPLIFLLGDKFVADLAWLVVGPRWVSTPPPLWHLSIPLGKSGYSRSSPGVLGLRVNHFYIVLKRLVKEVVFVSLGPPIADGRCIRPYASYAWISERCKPHFSERRNVVQNDFLDAERFRARAYLSCHVKRGCRLKREGLTESFGCDILIDVALHRIRSRLLLAGQIRRPLSSCLFHLNCQEFILHFILIYMKPQLVE